MSLIALEDVTIQFRGPPLLEGAGCRIDAKDRIGLLGRNGAGKTTLLKLLAGQLDPDSGTVRRSDGVAVALLPQDVPDHPGTIADVVRAGLPKHAAATDPAWGRELAVEQICTRMELDQDAVYMNLSTGWKRRVLLAAALVSQPDLLLLDEPTNHLDLAAIEWLEGFLSRWPKAFLFITHDRRFLRQLANRIMEIEDGRIYDWSCDYETFLTRKADAIAAREKQDALFDKRLAEEEVWIRKGIQARRTRNEGRVRALKEMRREFSQRRGKQGTSNVQIQTAERSGNLVLSADDLGISVGGRQIVSGYSTKIMRGERIGIIGPNGAGKTTLLKTLLGERPPEQGTIRFGTNVQIVYFDQMRSQLNPEATVQEDVADGYETVKIGGQTRHVIGYLQDFLFTPERARTPISRLSGGERNRVLLAKLFTKPANLIVLDEPTNDLDAETLEVLEERLMEYDGTLLIVSHDREFLNNVVTSTIVFEPDGLHEYAGGYDDWRHQRDPELDKSRVPEAVQKKGEPTKPISVAPAKKKLSYKETKELEALPALIEKLESQIAEIHAAMAEPSFYQRDAQEIAADNARLERLQRETETAYERWEELSS